MVEVIFTTNANIRLQEIYLFYRNQPKRLKFIVECIDKGVEVLHIFPRAGYLEPLLSGYPVGFRSLVVDKNYKLIYYIEANVVTITAIWDCRQDPVKLFDEL